MGYAHYWSRRRDLEAEAFATAAQDVRVLLGRMTDMGLKIAGPTGAGKPEVTNCTIAFNGAANCGHHYRDLGKPYAAETAKGVEEKDPPYNPAEQPAYSGPYLETRACGGSCAGEPFVIDRLYLQRDWERPEEADYFACSCETHFKPYDLLVTCVLVRLKERLGEGITLSSENPSNGFEDAKRICRQLFGWASKFEIREPALTIPPDL